MKKFNLLFFAVFLFSLTARADAALRTQTVEYRDRDTVLEGYIAYDDSFDTQRPGVLVVHEWKGLNDYAKRRAEQLAQMGYVALAIDMYGKGVRPQTHEEAGRISGMLKKDRSLMRQRATAGLEALKRNLRVDVNRLGAIGYCFGGTAALELARSGAELKGVVSFHGSLDTPNPEDAERIKGKLLICHGADDPHVTQAQVAAFEKEMKDAGVDYKLIQYPGAVHAFTVPAAGNDPSTGAAYNEEADKKSWEELKKFFSTIF